MAIESLHLEAVISKLCLEKCVAGMFSLCPALSSSHPCLRDTHPLGRTLQHLVME